MEKNIVYIAELDQDIDDIIAAEYLNKLNVLKCIVLDPRPVTKEGLERKQKLENLGISVFTDIPEDSKIIFVGGALSLVSDFVLTHKIDYLVMNGGFVGCNIVPEKEQLKKFKNKEVVRTFNFNCDVEATDKVLRSKNIENIILVGKNVCHNRINTPLGIWKNEKDLFEKYGVNETKLQHDMLACREGLIFLGLLKEEFYLNYLDVKPFNLGLNKTFTLWGSQIPSEKNPYNTVKAAISWKLKVST